MRIQGREKGFRIICLLWMTIPITVLIQYLTDGENVAFIIASLAATLVIILGAFVYLGHFGILAGFNTMSEKELKEFDMEKVTSFVGMGFTATGLVPFFAALFVMEFADEGTSFAIFFLLFMIMTLFVAFYPASKKFKTDP
jgi:hypothetical protein